MSPIQLYYDIQATNNSVYHERTKYIEVDCHFTRDKYQVRQISLSYVFSQSQLTDIFTKAFGHRLFHDLMRELNIRNFHTPI